MNARFDVHNRVLSTWSPLFENIDGKPKHVTKYLTLPTIWEQDFHLLMIWLYEDRHPAFTTPEGLRDLVQLWITAGALGMWKKQNTILRLCMELMQPPGFTVDIETIIYVYDNTKTDSKLRQFIAALFCQRAPVQQHFFSNLALGHSIWKDIVAFQKILYNVRMKNPVGINGYDFRKEAKTDYSRVRWPLPNYLVSMSYLSTVVLPPPIRDIVVLHMVVSPQSRSLGYQYPAKGLHCANEI